MDCFQDEASVEAPGEGAEVARQVFGADRPVCGQQTVFDIGKYGVCPAESGVARGCATGAGDVALVGDARLFGDAAKPLAAVADDGGPGLDTGAQPPGFTGLEAAHDLQAGVYRPAGGGNFDREDKGGVAASAPPGAVTKSVAAHLCVVGLGPTVGDGPVVNA